MNILLVYPQYPDSFWGFRNALRFISKKAAVPPLGLITISAMLPETWQKKLVDMNVAKLTTEDIAKADYVFISAMYIQKESVDKVLAMCLKQNVKVVVGGPLFTQEHANYPQIDHFILNEAEITMPLFLNDLESGGDLKRIYKTPKYADITTSPVPDYHLLSVKDYAFMNLQVSRGCPFACDFCEITALLGHKVRMKETAQVLRELDALYALNWRGPVSIVDDNFIGNKKAVKYDLLPAMKEWMQAHKYPFVFSTQSSLDLADDPELLELMIAAGIGNAFIGIETTDEISLNACNKVQNKNRDIVENIKKIQKAGLWVSGGFIVGFDSDSPRVFQQQIDFIQQSGIVPAMVGLLNAPKNTKLYNRLDAEKRLTVDSTGNNTDFTLNFIPKMNSIELMEGYKKIIKNIYSVKPYYQRVRMSLRNFNRSHNRSQKIDSTYFFAFFKSIFVLGIIKKGRWEYWRLLVWTLFKRPDLMVDAITFAVYGYHFRIVYGLSK